MLFQKGHIPWNKNKPQSKETKEKIRQTNKRKGIKPPSRKGYKLTKEQKKKLRENHPRYWLGKKRPSMSEEQKEKIRRNARINPNFGFKNKNHTEKTKEEIRQKSLEQFKDGMPKETKEKLSKANRGKKLKKDSDYISPKNERIRRSIEFSLWREAIFARDNWTCQKCDIKGGELHPHHIKNFAQYPELRFAIDNGITFCKKCHMIFHKKYGQRNNTKEQLKEFFIL